MQMINKQIKTYLKSLSDEEVIKKTKDVLVDLKKASEEEPNSECTKHVSQDSFIIVKS